MTTGRLGREFALPSWLDGELYARRRGGGVTRGSRRKSCFIAGLTTLVGLGLIPGAANATDVDTVGKWLTPAPKIGGMATQAATARTGDFSCTVTAAPVEAEPSGYVIGNCLSGVHLHRTQFDAASGNNWDGGEVFGNFNGCGWINNVNDAMLNGNAYTACSSPSRPVSDYIYWTADAGYWIWSNSSGNDGLSWNNPHPCPEYANYRPWSTSSVETDYLRTAPATPSPAAPILKVRYNAKYPSADGTGWYLMARDATVPSGQGDWVFIPSTCVNP